ncbi:MAG TPA: response regulator [Bacteroides sp.]|nr:response regulator [Bacteroides sp.]
MKMDADDKYSYDFKGRTVLVVEDNDISFKLISALLSRVNVMLVRATNGREAIEICRENPQISLVLMDLQLPEINGLEATRRIRNICPGLPVIATTANAFDEDEQACRNAGCAGYLSKPLQFRKLFELMQSFFDRQS